MVPATRERHRLCPVARSTSATTRPTTRSSGKIAFGVLRDGTGYLQVVLSKKDVPDAAWEAFAQLTQETSVEVTGTVRADPRAPGGVELTAADLKIIGPSHDFPITPKEHGTAFLFEHRHLWLRSRRQVAIARVRHEVIQAIRDFFYERHFVLVDTPILTGAIGEAAGHLFATEYFDLGTAYLAQTGQLYVEAAAAALGKAYCFGRTFRAEKSTTRRHLTASWMVQPEAASNEPAANRQLQAFYRKEDPADPRTVLNHGMPAPEGYGEIIGGSQREDDYDELLARIRAEQLPEDAYSWYLDLRKYGTFVHAGFGLGVERTVAWICGIPHIREAIAFPRTLYKLWP